jgi:hypothetical protein
VILFFICPILDITYQGIFLSRPIPGVAQPARRTHPRVVLGSGIGRPGSHSSRNFPAAADAVDPPLRTPAGLRRLKFRPIYFSGPSRIHSRQSLSIRYYP